MMDILAACLLGLVLIVLLYFANNRHELAGPVKETREGLMELQLKVVQHSSTDADLELWERYLAYLGKYPNEFNKLDQKVNVRKAFAQYLERHYPEDARLSSLQEAASWRREEIWGMNMKGTGRD
ncbi:hypothetical protein Q5741_20450 [Paenibacillus sp. JX-17]|uniref:DUF4363 family protein n=1 Tax=Paenibacillus lacisoli TaxID=3064525 RepID=A0ABT9CMD0_9BACL|nr:hypothetical protein [Paenibacillus sp. JX-17]MDO7908758.1 hypothetical protein [Paenibacillus sp. JX-17]